MDTLFEYGLTPTSMTVIGLGILVVFTGMWAAHRWGRQRPKK